ncbi:hypothetical protein FVEG_08473 [Fusarium verticillioides 7600]|uniref:F-box domain-containing protein n=1 Tax=Gibberella moniliformis (strain M3125 / FGSC 7600) TaxID=334819 RepID=W7MCS3_GIBM7|nr:hypothetical protein FVEG_08473 [Fusarium verticillioides 7600]EWG48811.1 hypothetical protein FVEG_08473 [Fusarium verticillioides 7600]
MSGPFLDLPPEVLFSISDYIEPDDRKNLSLANSGLRTAMAPCLFKVLRVNCPLVEDHILPTIVDKYGANILELRLNVTFYPEKLTETSDAEEEEEEEEVEEEESEDKSSDVDMSDNEEHDNEEEDKNEEEGYIDDGEEEEEEEEEEEKNDSDNEPDNRWYWDNPPASVWARKEADIPIIQDLIRFKGLPRCKALTIHTNGEKDFEGEVDWDNNNIGRNYIYFCCEPETWWEVQRKEQTYSWRAALRDMYRDIATLSPVDELTISNFLPRKTSFWEDKKWAEFLGRLKKLTLNTYGGNNGAGWQVNTLPGFHAFFNELSAKVLGHANALEYFKLKTHDDGFLGGAGSLYIPPGCMPALRSLHVDGIAVTSVLTDYLKEVNGTLSKLCITECVAFASDPNGDDAPRWADLWRAARQALKAPAEVICVPTKERPITEDEGDYYGDEVYVPPADEDDTIKSWRRKVKEEEGLCIWPYGWLDEKYGSIYPDHEVNLERLESWEDNQEFNLLMEEVTRGGGKCTVS